jgi:uncharacterized protein
MTSTHSQRAGGPRRTARPGEAETTRADLRFTSGDSECAAWHYPGTNGGCVVMAGGLAVPKEPATDQFARRFNQAGYSVLAFDYRRLGASSGEPRLRLPVRTMVADWHAALDVAATLPEVESTRVAAWGFSASGGVLLEVAAERADLAAVVAQTPTADGPAALRNASRYQSPAANLRFTGRALIDGLGGLLGRAPLLVPLAGSRGEVAMLTTPDVLDGPAALHADRYPDWGQRVSAWSALCLGFHRPGRLAPRISSPLLVVVCDDDRTSLAAPAAEAGRSAPRGEVVTVPGGHYAPFLGEHERAAGLELSFLDRHLLGGP